MAEKNVTEKVGERKIAAYKDAIYEGSAVYQGKARVQEELLIDGDEVASLDDLLAF
jgi:hypothetical protein